MKLSDSACRAAKPKTSQYKLADGGGLYLLVKPNGQRYWRMKFRHLGKESTFAIGAYPLVSLAEAREARDKAKKQLLQGINPNEAKREDSRNAMRESQNTFSATALEWYEVNKSKWAPKTAQTTWRRIEKYLLPDLGNRVLTGIKPIDVLDTLRKIEKQGTLDVAGRVRQLCGQIFRYGIQLDRCTHNPIPALSGALQVHKTEHHPSIDPKDLPTLVRDIQRNDARLYPQTRRALLLLMMVFVRPRELSEARWDEIDLEAGVWIIPAARMKKRRDLIVPLSTQAIALLKEQQESTDLQKSEYVFPGHKTWAKPISAGTLVGALKRLGYRGKMTAHGFRALGRTAIREQLDYQPDVIEAQLAHKAAGPLGEAYNRAQFIEQRKVMMQDWSDYIDRVSGTAKIIHANFGDQKDIA